jgi:hypothetical protein
MPLPKHVQDLFNDPPAIKTLATMSPEGVLHIIPVGSMGAPDVNTIAFAAIFMKEAHENLKKAKETGKLVSVLAVKAAPKEGIFLGFQARCRVKAFDTTGPIYIVLRDAVKKMGLEIRGAWILEPMEVISQSPGPEAGKKIA